ncbi:MAG: ChaN family lipoprotein [Deltaproteobacteria bacterium]|nr:ChaN family lipoprotein [Deltaproteobacteria bacterium]
MDSKKIYEIPFHKKLLCQAVIFTFSIITLTSCAVTQNKLFIKDIAGSFEAGTIVSAKTGQPVLFDALVTDLSGVRIVFVGENHTDPVHHEIQLKVIKKLYKINPDIAVGMEMFDYTYQGVLDQWSNGMLDQEEFLEKTHWYANWRYNFALYKDILDFIKEKKIKLVGLNVPSYIPARIRVGGIKNLSINDKKHLPDKIDTSNSAHRNYVKGVFTLHHHKVRKNFEYFYEAQCVWEEIMAQSIVRSMKNDKIVVLSGNGHIIRKFGIPDRVFSRIKEPFRTIFPARSGSEVKLSYADYIWVTPQKITKNRHSN